MGASKPYPDFLEAYHTLTAAPLHILVGNSINRGEGCQAPKPKVLDSYIDKQRSRADLTDFTGLNATSRS